MKKLVLAFIAFSLTLILLLTSVIAYFTDKKTTDDLTFTLGEVSYTFSGTFDSEFVMAGVNLLTEDIAITNSSSIETEIRLIITVYSSVFGAGTLDSIFGEDINQVKYYTLDNGWVLDSGYYYYRGTESVQNTPGIYSIPATNQTLPILTSIILDGYKFSNNHANGTFSIAFTFQAKQADFVTWQELGTANYNFTTGQ